MPAEKPRRIYWDSCVVLSFLEGNPERMGELDQLIREQQEEKFEIVTSVITRAEIIYVAGRTDEDSIEAINQIWTPGSPITPVEVFDQITSDACDLVRRQRSEDWGKLTPLDSIHLASAMRYATSMDTYDERLHKYSDIIGIPIGVPAPEQPQLSERPQGGE